MFDNIQFMGDHWVCWSEEEFEGTWVAYIELEPTSASIGHFVF